MLDFTILTSISYPIALILYVSYMKFSFQKKQIFDIDFLYGMLSINSFEFLKSY